jgi:hypothetical protein
MPTPMSSNTSHSLKEKETFNLSNFLESVWRDMRIGLRSLIMKPGFTFLVVLSLGLGIGANTVIFSVIDGILLRPVAVPHPGDIVTIDTAASHVLAGRDAPRRNPKTGGNENEEDVGVGSGHNGFGICLGCEPAVH